MFRSCFRGGGTFRRRRRCAAEKQGIAGGLRSVFVRCFVLRMPEAMPEAMPEVGWDDQKIMKKISHFLSEIFFFAGMLDKKVLFAIIDL